MRTERPRSSTGFRRASRVVLMAVAVLGAAPTAGAAQDAALQARVDAETLALVTPVLDAAVRDSLPVAPLRAKILEGAVKNRPPQLIAQVVGRLSEDLRTTRSTLRARLPAAAIGGAELTAAALARQQGVPDDALVELWGGRPSGQSLEIPVTVLTELVRRGVPAAGASALMRHVMDAGVPLDRAAQIPGRFDGAARPGVGPPEALERALRELNIPGPPEGRGPPPGRGPPGGDDD